MCGLFGVVTSRRSDPATTACVFAGMGTLSESRGRDAAGIAGFSVSGRMMFRARKVGTFRSLWAACESNRKPVRRARVLMGHTRWSSVGDSRDPFNVHPFRKGPIVGCHNGTTDRSGLIEGYGLQDLDGTTDSEAIIAALGVVPATPQSYLDVLDSAGGSASLAIVDARRDDAIVLVRGASSPLAVARATDGSVWWASLPEWFDSVGRHFGDYFDTPEIVAEHSVVTVSSSAIPQMRRWTPCQRLSA